MNVGGVVPVTGIGDPAGGLKAFAHIGGIRKRGRSVDGDVVVVKQHDQVGQLQMASQRDGFMADAFHQIAVRRHHIGFVMDQVIAEARVQNALGQRHAHRIAQTLTQRAGGRLDPRGMAIFGVPGARAAHFAEILDVVDGDAVIAGEPEQGIKQHRTVATGQHKAVAVGPGRIARVKFQEMRIQNTCHIGHAHRHAGMAGFGVLHGIHRKGADGIGQPARLGLLGYGRRHGFVAAHGDENLYGGLACWTLALARLRRNRQEAKSPDCAYARLGRANLANPGRRAVP